jgi:hypothetical protein
MNLTVAYKSGLPSTGAPSSVTVPLTVAAFLLHPATPANMSAVPTRAEIATALRGRADNGFRWVRNISIATRLKLSENALSAVTRAAGSVQNKIATICDEPDGSVGGAKLDSARMATPETLSIEPKLT